MMDSIKLSFYTASLSANGFYLKCYAVALLAKSEVYYLPSFFSATKDHHWQELKP